MKEKLASWYLDSAGLILACTAVAKLVSCGSPAKALQTIDPLFGLPFATVFFAGGLVELAVAHYDLKWTEILPRAFLIAWISTSFLAYRAALSWLGWHKPCGCLGTFTEALHLSPQTADTIMKWVLGYLLVGSYACIIIFRKKGAGTGTAPPGVAGPEA